MVITNNTSILFLLISLFMKIRDNYRLIIAIRKINIFYNNDYKLKKKIKLIEYLYTSVSYF